MENNVENKTEAPKEPDKQNAILSEIWEYVKMLISVALLVLVVNGVILINAKIPSGSMESTIMTGDRIFGLRLAYGLNMELGDFKISKKWADPERFDIIIFKYPDDNSQLFIKRLIGLPGETIEVRDGKVYINDSETPLDDSFTNEIPKGDYFDFGPVTIPEDSYFMMGDNRNHSNDSRFWNDPFVSFDEIVGKALFRYYPITEMKIVK
ncbi:MAG: signal peptidase I [Clostridiales bacterium]|nr:signal peptidase I [Candidatus Blautia equi]